LSFGGLSRQMKLIIIEDNEDEIEVFQRELAKREDIEVLFARSRDRALQMIASQNFDFAVIDLKIPASEGGLDTDTSHGLAVRAALGEQASGTPAIIFSAFATLPLVQNLLNTTESHDIWGNGKLHPMTLFKQKSELGDCLALINAIADEIKTLSLIEISFGAQPLDLSYEQAIILRIFARLYGGTNIRVSALGGGLSGAKTCRLQVEDEHRMTTCYAVVKLGTVADLREEYRRFEAWVAPVLNVGAFAHVIRFLTTGAGRTGGLFYGLAKEYDWTLLDALRNAPASTPEIVRQIRGLENAWQHAAPKELAPISKIRRELLSDKEIHNQSHKLSFDWQQLESVKVWITRCRQHRDLHGLNVLLKNRQVPLLIDFAEVGIATASLDPLTLELSLLFHPACKSLYPGWPSMEQAQQWDDLDAFTSGCPGADYVRACRKWAFEIEAGDNAVFASAYAYAVRQLKYPDTDHNLAAAIAHSASRRLL